MLRRCWTVALVLAAVVGALYVPLTASAVASPTRLGSRLVHRFFNELVRRDLAGLGAFLSPAFQIQRADGSRENKAHYLANPPDVLSYRLRGLVVTTARGVVVVTYRASTIELVGGKRQRSAFAPRISTFVRGAAGWKLVSHANFNPTRLAMTLYGHPDEHRARDRLRMAFVYDGHKSPKDFPRHGHTSDASA